MSTTTLSKSTKPKVHPRVHSPFTDGVFAGGVALHTLNLVGGPPGVGKTVAMLQLANILSEGRRPVVFIATSELAATISQYAKRLALKHVAKFAVTDSVNIDQFMLDLKNRSKDTICVLDTLAGFCDRSPARAIAVMTALKRSGITWFVTVPTTKANDFWGPMDLQEIADSCSTLFRLTYSDDNSVAAIQWRMWKNRFGKDCSTDYDMTEKGLVLQPQAKPAKKEAKS